MGSQLTKEDEEKIIIMYNENKSMRKIAKQFDVSHEWVRHVLMKYKADIRKKTCNSSSLESYKDKIIDMRKEGKPATTIVRILKIGKRETMKQVADYARSIPKYGNADIRKCHTCGKMGDVSIFCDARSLCKECRAKYYREYNLARKLNK